MTQTKTKQYIGLVLGFVILAVVVFAPVKTEAQSTTTDDIADKVALLQNLMKQIQDLQKQLAEIRGEIRTEVKAGLKEGMSDEDIRKIQELLATDPTIYPEGITSGYYGPLTKNALKRFQAKHQVNATGEIDEETRKLIMEYFKEKVNGKFPPGLLRAPGIEKKVRLQLDGFFPNQNKNVPKCELKEGGGFTCRDVNNNKDKNKDKDKDEDEDDAPFGITEIDAEHSYDDGTHTYTGEISLPTPCHELDVEAHVLESLPEQIKLEFEITNTDQICAQVITEVDFEVEAEASEEATTTSATINGKKVKLNLTEEDND